MASILGVSLKDYIQNQKDNKVCFAANVYLRDKPLGIWMESDGYHTFGFDVSILTPVINAINKAISNLDGKKSTYCLVNFFNDLASLTEKENDYKQIKEKCPDLPLTMVVFGVEQEEIEQVFMIKMDLHELTDDEVVKFILDNFNIREELLEKGAIYVEVYRDLCDFNIQADKF